MTAGTIRPADLRRYRTAVLRRFTVRTEGQCQRFVDALGFCYAFTAGPGGIPGLFDVIGTRSVDRMWSWAWTWKDNLVTRRRVFYGRILRRKPTFIALAYLPHFYALSGNVGEPDDYLVAYRAGRLSLLAKALFEYVARHPRVTTWELRREFVSGDSSGSRLHRALEDLQAHFLIAKVAEVEGRGNYAYIWDTFARWMPDVVREAGRIGSPEAAEVVLRGYLKVVGAAGPHRIEDLFGWPPSLLAPVAARVAVATASLDGEALWTLPGVLRAVATARSARRLRSGRRP